MNRPSRAFVVFLAGFCIVATGPLFADLTYESTSQLTGGFLKSMGRFAPKELTEPQVTTTMISGSRYATAHRTSIDVFDVDKETVTHIDHARKTYSVLTFAQMSEVLRKMEEKLKQRTGDRSAEMQIKVHVKETGATRDVSGFACRQVILTLDMEMQDAKSGQKGAMQTIADMWLTKDLAGYRDLRALQEKMAGKMGVLPVPGGFQAGPQGAQMGQMMKALMENARKMEGVPMLQLVTITSSQMAGMPAMPEAAAGGQPPAPSAGEVAQQAGEEGARAEVARRLGGLAGLGGFGRRKKQAEQKQPETPPAQAPSASTPSRPGALMEMKTEVTSFSTAAIEPAKLTVPAGYKQEPHPMLKGLE